MEYRKLGKTGLNVSVIGLGGIPLQRVSQEEATVIIDRCLELGVNFIDTARGYTDSEEKIGAALKGKPRDKVVLATKSMARTKEAMTKDIDLSLKNLQTDYIDLYQCHNIRFDEEENVLFGENGALEALLAAKKAGKIRHIGLTCHQLDRAGRLLRQYDVFETVQVPYNFTENKAETEILPLTKAKDIGVIVMKPLGGGALPSEYALRYFIDKPVNVIIPGMDSIQQVEENISYVQSSPLNENEKAELENIKRDLGKNYCRRCDYCRPCPAGIDISGMFIIHGYFKRYNLQDWALARYAGTAVKPDACTECGQCESRCPYELPIRNMLKAVYQDMNEGLGT